MKHVLATNKADEYALVLNSEHIAHIRKHENGEDTIVTMSDGTVYEVEESMNTLYARITKADEPW